MKAFSFDTEGLKNYNTEQTQDGKNRSLKSEIKSEEANR
jgi:hypothetical protein